MDLPSIFNDLDGEGGAVVRFKSEVTGGEVESTRVRAGVGKGRRGNGNFVHNATHDRALTRLMQGHIVDEDLLILSAKGGGKSELSREFCDKLGYDPMLFTLYKDLSSRDLLQRR